MERGAFRKAAVNTLERRLFYIPSFKIYRGVAGFYDYGSPGCSIESNVLSFWRQVFKCSQDFLKHAGFPPNLGAANQSHALVIMLCISLARQRFDELPSWHFGVHLITTSFMKVGENEISKRVFVECPHEIWSQGTNFFVAVLEMHVRRKHLEFSGLIFLAELVS